MIFAKYNSNHNYVKDVPGDNHQQVRFPYKVDVNWIYTWILKK